MESHCVHGQAIYVDPKAEMVVVHFASHPRAGNAANDPTSLPAYEALADHLLSRERAKAATMSNGPDPLGPAIRRRSATRDIGCYSSGEGPTSTGGGFRIDADIAGPEHVSAVSRSCAKLPLLAGSDPLRALTRVSEANVWPRIVLFKKPWHFGP